MQSLWYKIKRFFAAIKSSRLKDYLEKDCLVNLEKSTQRVLITAGEMEIKNLFKIKTVNSPNFNKDI
jgi:hypothetical protein